MSALKSPNKLFRQAKGHMVMENRGNEHIPTRHIDVEGTVNISFTHDGDTPGLIIRESISWDGETDTTRFVPCPVERPAKQRTRAPRRGPGEMTLRMQKKARARAMKRSGKKKVSRRASAGGSDAPTPSCEEAAASQLVDDTETRSGASVDAEGSRAT